MNRVSPAPRPFRICARCRRQLFPRLAAHQWTRDGYRDAISATPAADPRAEKVRRRVERKEWRRRGVMGAVKLFLDGRVAVADVPRTEECADCQRLNRRTA